MLGFGSFGNYSFPVRPQGTPQSGRVLSDQEFGDTWKAKLNGVPQHLIGTNTTQLIAGNADYDPTKAQPYLDQIRQDQRSEWDRVASGWSQEDRDANWNAALNMGYIPTIGEDGAIDLLHDSYTQNLGSVGRGNIDALGGAGSHTTTAYYNYLNPEYTKTQNSWVQADKERGENTIRQQQSYNTNFLGNGQIGGVIGQDYSAPGFGQVTGQATGASTAGMPGFGGLTGINDTSQTGAYSPGAGRYNPSPYAPDSFQNKNPWAFL